MSTLTKVLVVLLTLSTIFLSGIVVTYVSSATNYKKGYDRVNAENSFLNERVVSLQSNLSEGLQSSQARINDLQKEFDQITVDNAALRADALSLKTQNASLNERVISQSASVEMSQQIIAELTRDINNARSDLDKVRGELLANTSQLSQVRIALEESIVQLDALEVQKMRLLEEKTAIEARLAGQTVTETGIDAVTLPVTVDTSRPRLVSSPVSNVALEGRVKTVVLDENIATVSIGSANGLKRGDVLHVVRGEEFICNIVITNVDPQTAAGDITMLRSGLRPATGDIVTNKL